MKTLNCLPLTFFFGETGGSVFSGGKVTDVSMSSFLSSNLKLSIVTSLSGDTGKLSDTVDNSNKRIVHHFAS